MIGRRRRGFTLLEVLVALVITAMVASVAFAAAQTGIDVRARLDRARRETSSATALREVLHDALRHAESGADGSDTTFALGARRGELLRVTTRGVLPPLGSGGRWAVSLSATPDGLTLIAVPTRGDGTAVRLVAPELAGADVRALDRIDGAWRTTWDRPSATPLAVTVRFLDAKGRDAIPALVARTQPAGAAEDAP